ncbi:MAG: hypothetical protein RLZZ337_666 [Bacteroidota bacterium]|jgi:hypothetical protein
MKPTLKIRFVDTYAAEVFTNILSIRYDVVIDNSPDFLIFGDENFGTTNLSYSKNDCIKIFYTGENRRPENYDCHYAVTFDYNSNPWHYRLPLWALVPYFYKNFDFNHITKAHNIKIEKTKFCAFIHRNPGNSLRNTVFHELCKYKKVDSAGPLFNNTGKILSPEYYAKLDFIKDYKFVFAFENSSYEGYVTEKIMDAFYVNAVPIYWGDPTINTHFNEKSFINAHLFTEVNELINYIIKVDEDTSLYNSIVCQPKLKDNIIPSCMIYDNFLNWFDTIVYNKLHSRA